MKGKLAILTRKMKFVKNGDLLPNTFELALKPTEGKCFKVNPKEINRTLFLEKRVDEQQEMCRIRILEALKWVDKDPEKYGEVFYLLIPMKKWVYGRKKYTTVQEQIEFAERIGGYISTYITEALAWAQCITNGESWEEICNNKDTVKYFRLIIGKNGEAILSGGSSKECHSYMSASYIDDDYCSLDFELTITVPSVVLKSLQCVQCDPII